MEETQFPIDSLTNDPTVRAKIEDLKIPNEKIKEIEGAIVSIKVSGIKPKDRD